jgi:3-hydroxybutyryl-CoA dehydratase
MSDQFVPGHDFDQLRAGARFSTAGRTITEADLVSFSALTGDRHPLHADATWADRSQFGGRIAHGMMLLSYAVGLAPFDSAWVVALRGIDAVSFRRPVRIGDTVHLRGEVTELREVDAETGLVTFAWQVVNQRGETAVRARVKALWRRRPTAAEAPQERESSQPAEVYL